MNNQNELYKFDVEMRAEHGIICGVDEAGRGPLAGDVYAAAVILPENIFIGGLNDSKKLTEKKRLELYDIIIEKAVAYSIMTASVEEIDTLNIEKATFVAMQRAVGKISKFSPNLIIVDGNRRPEFDIKSMSLIKGDSKSASVAAASILAKVERDRYMKALSEKYPQYLFEKHKGYGTKLHYEMIEKHGISDVHRRSFLKKVISHNE